MKHTQLKSSIAKLIFVNLLMIAVTHAQESPTWYVDKTGGKDSFGLIHICARPSLGENQSISGWLPGHVYIGLFPTKGDVYMAVGAYPSENVGKWDNLFNAAYSQGRLHPEYASIKGEHCVVVDSSEDQFNAVSEIIINTDNNEPYILGFEDCVALGKRAAVSLGLKVSTGALTRPRSFILNLAKANNLN